jgi:Domain of unknown function (DUF5916)
MGVNSNAGAAPRGRRCLSLTTIQASRPVGKSRGIRRARLGTRCFRRIGRAPQLTPDAQWIDAPEQTRIIGAAKLSGQVGHGWSIGLVDAVTQREGARIVDTSGKYELATVEPAANYFVGRVKRDFDDGGTTIGVLSTAVDRSMDPSIASALRRGAYLFGVDGTRATRDRRWQAGGYLVQSLVTGTAASIAATQRSSVHYFARPDASYLTFDSSRTSLQGHDAALGVVYRGAPWLGSMQVHEAGMSKNSGTDARFPYEHRQNVVVRLCMFLLLEQARDGESFHASQSRRAPVLKKSTMLTFQHDGGHCH